MMEGKETARSIKLNEALLRRWWRLRFPSVLEQDFRDYYFRHYQRRMRLLLALGIMLYAAYGLYDYLVIRDQYPAAWLIRYAAGLPVGLLALGLTWLARNDRQMQWLYFGVLFYGGLSYTWIMQATDSQYPVVYADPVLIILFISYTVIGLRFVYASLTGVAISLCFLWALLEQHSMAPEVVRGQIITFAAMNAVGMVAAFLVERRIRDDFLRAELLRERTQALAQANLRLNELSRTDELTRLANRRLFNEAYAYEWARCARHGEPLSLMLLDIDHFKRLNDKEGHAYGDEVLREIAPILQAFARRTGDLAARLGGEEFVIMLPGCDLDDAMERAEALRDSIERLEIPHPDSPLSRHVTVSIGLATTQPRGREPLATCLAAANRFMYEAKQAGRNCVRGGPWSPGENGPAG